MKTNILQAKKALLALFAMLMPLLASAHDFEVDGIYYNITSSSDLTVAVTYRGSYYNSYSNEYSGAITIPSTVTYNSKTYSVTSIGNDSFSGCENLIDITLPEGVTSIGNYAFAVCSNLTTITLPESMNSIGTSAFYSCISLATITIPESVTSIGNEAFYECRCLFKVINYSKLSLSKGSSNNGCVAYYAQQIIEGSELTTVGDFQFLTFNDVHYLVNCIGKDTNITLPNDYKGANYDIGDYAFAGCINLTAINIPEGVTSIGEYAFRVCSSLTAITLPKGVTNIGDRAFYGCSSLTAITIPEGVTSIREGTFWQCSSLTTIALSEGVTSIGSSAFSNCKSLTAITIPESVTSIGYYAFMGCSSLTAITCEATTPPTIGNSYTFYEVDKSIPIYVPAGSVDAYKIADYWSEFTNIQPLSNGYILTVSSAGYATLFLDYAAKIPDNVKAYIGTRVEGNRLMMTRVTDVLPANTGVIVRAEAGTYTFEEYKDMPANVEGNLLSGTATDTYITAESGYKYYVLSQKEGLVAMYRPILTDGRFLNNANKAYIALDTNRLGIYDDEVNTDEEGGQLSNSLRFDFGGTTTIENLQFTIDNSQIIYDLHGRRITDTEGLKGIYIMNGRKVVI